ncbi:hypothetical protein [Gimesia fumaroli]|uniref:Uncharacterized protein n=1 Tax=Gimesia fumaroli TaxID=2527976 RepID=A0A518ICJ5_9PLAN|nr:hypothetical protein [Gimesia fumaroli]QDV50826.1 hypothetical protein Enr17x_28710 [Gimesia fumaroli]
MTDKKDFEVPCVVSRRSLQFSSKGTQRLNLGEVIELDVMTMSEEDVERKICSLYITREKLLAVLDLIEPASYA